MAAKSSSRTRNSIIMALTLLGLGCACGYVFGISSAYLGHREGPMGVFAPVELQVKVVDPQPSPAPTDLFVGVLSHPANVERRRHFRDTCAPKYKAAGVPFRIFMGRPSVHVDKPSGWQGQHATPVEIQMSRNLVNESQTFKDIHLFPMREHYRDLTDKVIRLYQYGLHSGASFIAKLDDDQCLDVARVREDIRRERAKLPRPEIYLGTHMWKGTEYDIMRGPHNNTSPYMGSTSLLSRDLAHAIFEEDRDHTVMYSVNGTSSEDTNMGRFVQRATERNPSLKISWLANPKYLDYSNHTAAGTKV